MAQKLQKYQNPDAPLWPMRINKAVARLGYTTRTGADELIKKGKVTINGKKAILGDKVLEKDKIEVSGAKRKYKYFAYHKPRGVISHSPQLGEKDAATSSELGIGVFPVGRLDKDSRGLMIMTDDARVTDKLLNPEYEHEKEYRVTTNEKIPSFFQKRMEEGIDIEGYMTKPCSIKLLAEKKFGIILTEGKKHQIRRMCAALGLTVSDLERVRVMNVSMGPVPRNGSRPIQGLELVKFLHALGVKQ